MVDNSEINEVENFWSSNPMTYGIEKSKTPEEVRNNAAFVMDLAYYNGEISTIEI